MLEILIGLVLVMAVIAFAIFGFCVAMVRLFGDKNNRARNSAAKPLTQSGDSSLQDDIVGASRLLNFLFRKKKLDQRTYQRTWAFLEKEFADDYEFAKKIEFFVDDPVLNELESRKAKAAVDESREIVEPDLVEVVPVAGLVSDGGAQSAEGNQRTSPWDMPDPPAPEPRRSFKEMLSAFMLDKNIRWGELASGILIIGSAVGLVISLRNELQDTIPYFSALLFLLITAAIHGAGIYTLQKWNLRNTSRGTLLIGLLLIPLNFLAACILSSEDAQRRELTDPLLWTAVIVGLTSFGAMTWFSGKCLVRAGQLPLTLSIMGGAIGTLIINRAEGIDESTLVKLGLSLVLVVSFLAGTLFVFRNQWTRTRWPRRASFRIFTYYGIAAFAFINGAAMLVIRAEENPPTWVSLAPSFSIVAMIGAWFGHIIWKGAEGRDSRALGITGVSMFICGLLVVAIAWVASFSNPMVLLIISMLLAIGFGIFAYHRTEPRLLVPGWIAFGSFILCGVNLIAGKLPWNEWANLSQLGDAALSGRSGIALLAVGTVIVGFHFLWQRRTTDPARFNRVGFASGAVVFAMGLVLAIVASFVNRENQFDNMTATILLGLASLLGIAGTLRVGTPLFAGVESKHANAIVATVGTIVFLFLAHAFGWNMTLSEWLDHATFSIGANWPLIFTMHAFIISGVAAIGYYLQQGNGSNDSGSMLLHHVTEQISNFAALTSSLGLAGAIFLIPHQTGIATAIALTITIACFLVCWSQQQNARVSTWSALLTLMSACFVAVLVAEMVTRQDWCPSFSNPRHFLIQSVALSVWFLIWLIASWALTKSPSFRFLETERYLTVVIGTGLTALLVAFVGLSLAFESGVELYQNAAAPLYSVASEPGWTFAACLALVLALLLAAFKEPVRILGAAFVTVWSLAWAAGAFYLADEKAVATGMRWLIPIGGAIGAAIIASRKPVVPLWAVTRNKAGLTGRSVWPKSVTQQLINLSLAIVAISVMTISTLTIVQAMVFGIDTLGGPIKGTLFGDMKKDVSFGIPVAVIVNTFLLYAISEKRPWLATAGSLVFQYCVLLSVVLLFVSPHPKLASSWFVNILQAVSIGMTGYGFVWWYFKDRIKGAGPHQSSTAALPSSTGQKNKTSQLEVHTLINGLLITSLAVLVMSRFFRLPQISGDWINSVGGAMGVGAWAMFAVLVVLVWRQQLKQSHRTSSWMWLAGWSGLVLVGMLAAFLDRGLAAAEATKPWFGFDAYVPWLTFNLIMCGAVVVAVAQLVLLSFLKTPLAEATSNSTQQIYVGENLGSRVSRSIWSSIRSSQTIALLATCLIAMLFSVRGMNSGTNFWPAFAAAGCVVALLTIGGLLRQSGWLGFVAAGVTTVSTLLLVQNDPMNWFAGQQPYAANVLGVVLTMLAMIWTGYYAVQTVMREKAINPRLVWMSNSVMLLAAAWLMLGAIAQSVMELEGVAIASCLKNGWGVALFVTTAMLGCLNLWNRSRKGLVVSACLWWFSVVIFATVVLVPRPNGLIVSAVTLTLGAAVAVLGLIWSSRKGWLSLLSNLKAPNLEKFERSMFTQLPIAGTVASLIVVTAAFAISLNLDGRTERYLASFSPFGLAIGFGCWSNANRRRWVQILSLALLTIGAIFVAWSDLTPKDIRLDFTRLFVRALLVFAAAMFVYGGLVSRFVRHGDTWLKSLKEMAVVTCGLALACLVVVVTLEFDRFKPDIGCGMPAFEAIAVAVAVIAMAIGLLVIAFRKENDPFALSLHGRMWYVYIAQLVAALLVLHLYFTMPFLFQFGIKDYWPYIAMIVSFAGVGMSHQLQKRKLEVFGEPVFNTSAILPLVVALAIWGVDSKADHALVTLIIGLAYLMISYIHRSPLCGFAAKLFGNLSLWLFYNKFDGFSFTDHPQLWLIPPALSVLVAAQIKRKELNSGQLALIRYICVTTIYLSSTSEIFINGLGAKLWPPMILAVLSVLGIFAGMLFQIRAYLYLGALFLLMAMVTMVSHAHQRLEHVWPWWAFGITMGIAILVMFGLFEKRKNDMREVIGQLKDWEL